MNSVISAHYRDEFARVRAALPGRRLPWLAAIREQALSSFRDSGFPTLRDEDWKYTSVARIENSRFPMSPPTATTAGEPAAVQIAELALPGAQLLVFIDGRFAPALSRIATLPAGMTLASLAEVLDHPTASSQDALQSRFARPISGYPSGFDALNAACMADGAYIRLPAGTALDAPIQLLFVAGTANLATHCRNVVIAEQGSHACIIEQHAALGAACYFSNVVTDITLGRGAEIEHYKLQQESPQSFHVATVSAELGEQSRFVSGCFALGGALARTGISVRLNAERASCQLDGLYLVDGRRHVDHHTRIDHARAHGTSREFYKGVLGGAARAVFNGKLIVHRDAQHSDALQTNRNLLLSDQAEVDTKPQLEIWADDVKCGHGATVGQLDDEQIFYLRSRGLGDQAARALLTYAFAAEITDAVRLKPLRLRLDQLLRAQLRQPPQAQP